jgi:hypothetical protein
MTASDPQRPAHLAAAVQLRQQRAALGATNPRHGAEEVQLRLLSDYDQAFGLDDGEVA